MRKSQGFTLLELLMVVIIIAILASIALPQYIKAMEKSRASEALQLLGQVRSAEGRYKAQSPTNVFTANQFDLDAVDNLTGNPTRFWGTVGGAASNLTITAGGVSAVLTRNTGAYGGRTLGMRSDNGQICGNFAQVVIDPGAPSPCP